MPMGMAAWPPRSPVDALHALQPGQPAWLNRDRFVLSAGHGSMLLYTMLHLTGYDLPLEELRSFRQWGSKTPGHPEVRSHRRRGDHHRPAGRGLLQRRGHGAGRALAGAALQPPGFDVVDHYTYAIVSDGDLMEGVASEAASLAGHLQLGKLIYLYDDNHITIDGKTDVSYTEDWAGRFEGYGWHVQKGSTPTTAPPWPTPSKRPKPTRGPASSAARASSATAAPTAPAPPRCTAKRWAPTNSRRQRKTWAGRWSQASTFRTTWPPYFAQARSRGAALEAAYAQLAAYAAAYPAEAAELKRMMAGELPAGWEAALPVFPPSPKGDATRNSSGKVLNALAKVIPT
jgi:transketolase